MYIHIMEFKHNNFITFVLFLGWWNSSSGRRIEQTVNRNSTTIRQVSKQLDTTEILSFHRIYLHRISKELNDTKEEASRSAAETERLLQLVQMTQEEQNQKEKTIMDLQQ